MILTDRDILHWKTLTSHAKKPPVLCPLLRALWGGNRLPWIHWELRTTRSNLQLPALQPNLWLKVTTRSNVSEWITEGAF